MRCALALCSRSLFWQRAVRSRAAAMATAKPRLTETTGSEALAAAAARPSFSVLLLGDTMLGRLVDEQLQMMQARGEGPERVWGDTLALAKAADVRLLNLECAITDHPEPWTATPQAFHFRGSPSRALPVLRAAGVHAVSLANNHVLDFNAPGMLETLRSIDGAGIARAGAGRSLAEARAPALVTVRAGSTAAEVRIAMIAAADHPVEWAAHENSSAASSGGINLFDPFPSDEALAWARDAAAAARAGGAHLVVLALHYGSNWVSRPPAAVRAFAHALAESSDVDVLFGTSAHVAQGVEVHAGKLLIYQAGDVIDDYAVDERWRNDLGAAFTARFELHDAVDAAATPTTTAHPPSYPKQQQASASAPRQRAKLCGVMITPLLLPFAEVRVAPPGAAVTRAIATRLRKLSAELGTQLVFDEAKGVLRWPQ